MDGIVIHRRVLRDIYDFLLGFPEHDVNSTTTDGKRLLETLFVILGEGLGVPCTSKGRSTVPVKAQANQSLIVHPSLEVQEQPTRPRPKRIRLVAAAFLYTRAQRVAIAPPLTGGGSSSSSSIASPPQGPRLVDATMYRVAGSHLRSLKHHGASRFASTSVVKQSSGGLFSWLLGGNSSQLPPLDVPLPGITIPPPLPDYVELSKTKITTLPNGIKIASETSPGPAASVGLYIDCGSIYETPASSGASHLLERMAFKSTTNRSHLRLVREVEAIGGNVSASASREQMSYTYDALKSYAPEMVEVLLDSVRNPAFLEWEVKEQLQKIKSEITEVSSNPQGLLLEALHSAGYSGALAKPLMATESAVNRLDISTLEEFIHENYTAPRMVLAASGVEHDELVSIAEPLLSDLPSLKHHEEPKSVYVGGDYRCQADSPNTHIALAFEVPGGWRQEKTAMIVTVLQVLMGGGGSFSAGGPGKGMHSRLYLRVLNNYQQIESFSAFNSIYNNSGLFGIHAATSPDFASKAVDLAAAELLEVATPGKVTQEQLDRAKEATKAAVLMNLESRIVASEDIGRQVLTYGERKPIEYFVKAVEDITLNDISSIGQKIISSSLTLASWGDVIHVPSYESVSRKFHSK